MNISLTDQELIKKFNLKPADKILDVGGSMKQHEEIKIDTLVDIISPEESPYNKGKLLAKKFVRLNLNEDKFPFSDKYFDFCLCTHTLEDLPYPFLAIKEMQRVAKRGYIATPSMGADITMSHINFTDWETGARRVPGVAHHKWLFIEKEGVMKVIPKNYPLLYSSEFNFAKWLGDREFRFYWKNKIKYEQVSDIHFANLIKEYRKFVNKNQKKLTKSISLIYLDKPWYFFKEIAKLILSKFN